MEWLNLDPPANCLHAKSPGHTQRDNIKQTLSLFHETTIKRSHLLDCCCLVYLNWIDVWWHRIFTLFSPIECRRPQAGLFQHRRPLLDCNCWRQGGVGGGEESGWHTALPNRDKIIFVRVGGTRRIRHGGRAHIPSHMEKCYKRSVKGASTIAHREILLAVV